MTSIVKCHHTQTHEHNHTYIHTQCGFPLGPANEALAATCAEGLLLMWAHTNTHTHQFEGYMGKDIKDNNMTGLSHVKPPIQN